MNIRSPRSGPNFARSAKNFRVRPPLNRFRPPLHPKIFRKIGGKVAKIKKNEEKVGKSEEKVGKSEEKSEKVKKKRVKGTFFLSFPKILGGATPHPKSVRGGRETPRHPPVSALGFYLN